MTHDMLDMELMWRLSGDDDQDEDDDAAATTTAIAACACQSIKVMN